MSGLPSGNVSNRSGFPGALCSVLAYSLSLHSIRFSRFPQFPGYFRVGFASQVRCWREEIYYLVPCPVSRTFFRNLKICSCRCFGALQWLAPCSPSKRLALAAGLLLYGSHFECEALIFVSTTLQHFLLGGAFLCAWYPCIRLHKALCFPGHIPLMEPY